MLDHPLNNAEDALAIIGDAEWYADGPTRLLALDLSEKLRRTGPVTSPGLCANFARILPGETLSPDIAADATTSQGAAITRG
jgi:hypothetical protein